MARVRELLALLLALAGLVFIGQGLGLIRGRSFMVDDIRWAWVGAAMVVVALAAMGWGRWRGR